MEKLKALLTEWEKAQPKPEAPAQPVKERIYSPSRKEIVAGGEVLWKPVDKQAAKMLSKAPWWAQPTSEPKYETASRPEKAPTHTPRKEKAQQAHPFREGGSTSGELRSSLSHGPTIKKNAASKRASRKRGGKNSAEIGTAKQGDQMSKNVFDENVTQGGYPIHMVNGEPMFKLEEIQTILAAEIAKLPKETRPQVRAAEDAREIINELLQGIGGDMEKFRADTKRYIDDIRSTRFTIVAETSQITGALKEVRQFFLGSDYKEEIARLKEFVDLCERLNKLKESGFLDSVADTMIRLAV